MKKIFGILFLISFLTILVVPLFTASAQVSSCCKLRKTISFEGTTYTAGTCYGETTTCTVSGCTIATVKEEWGVLCVLNSIYRVADLIFAVLIAFAVLMILLAAFTFITAGGAPEKVNKARDYILYALVGSVVAILAAAIPSIVKMLV